MFNISQKVFFILMHYAFEMRIPNLSLFTDWLIFSNVLFEENA